jgi:hypothetical protein
MANSCFASPKALVLAALLLAGCAGEGSENLFTTGSLNSTPTAAAAPEPKVDPICVSLVSQIDSLRKEGIADKIEKAAARKYRLTSADLKKANHLTKASADLQMRCSTITPASAQPPAAAPPPPAQKTTMTSGRDSLVAQPQ